MTYFLGAVLVTAAVSFLDPIIVVLSFLTGIPRARWATAAAAVGVTVLVMVLAQALTPREMVRAPIYVHEILGRGLACMAIGFLARLYFHRRMAATKS